MITNYRVYAEMDKTPIKATLISFIRGELKIRQGFVYRRRGRLNYFSDASSADKIYYKGYTSILISEFEETVYKNNLWFETFDDDERNKKEIDVCLGKLLAKKEMDLADLINREKSCKKAMKLIEKEKAKYGTDN